MLGERLRESCWTETFEKAEKESPESLYLETVALTEQQQHLKVGSGFVE